MPLSLALLAAAPAFAAGSAGEDAFQNARTWTVQIRTSVDRPFINDSQGSFQGAGLVIDAKRGWVLTNAHVASRSYSHITVAFQDTKPIPAERLYVDPHLDLAIIAYDPASLATPPREPKLECEHLPAVGHPVGAFGHPWGFRFTGTRGITSAVTSRLGSNMLQTDAPINAGNSGGPLISLESGRVVGVNAAKISEESVEGLSFAVPMPYACTVIDLLERDLDPSPPARLVDFAVDMNEEQTMIVARSRLPSGTLDLRVGDELLAVARTGRALSSESDLIDALRGHLDAVVLRIRRGGAEQTIEGRWPAASPIIERRGLWISGALFAEAESLSAGQLTGTPALMVHHVAPGSSAEAEGLHPFDMLLAIDGRPVGSLNELESMARNTAGGKEPMNLMLLRLASSSRDELFVYQHRTLAADDVELVGPVPEAGASTTTGSLR
jgi:serine protease Do/serine protease DegQ